MRLFHGFISLLCHFIVCLLNCEGLYLPRPHRLGLNAHKRRPGTLAFTLLTLRLLLVNVDAELH